MSKGINGQPEIFRFDSMDEDPVLYFGEGVAFYFSKIMEDREKQEDGNYRVLIWKWSC